MGERVGIPWLGHTCGVCPYCRIHRENLCDHPVFTADQPSAQQGGQRYVAAGFAEREGEARIGDRRRRETPIARGFLDELQSGSQSSHPAQAGKCCSSVSVGATTCEPSLRVADPRSHSSPRACSVQVQNGA
jgi:Alcohol dehydrogenase GroES-like domain